MACSARIVTGLAVVAWGTESYLGLALRTSVLGMGQTVRLGKTNTMICKSRMEIYFFGIFYFLFCYVNFFFFIWLLFYLLRLQNRQVMVTSLGRCCSSGTRV